ncbi:hypothetical protein M3Y99_00215500 [Aphelenchoides fujianensis]|nr:hypothetical protein M3Y99_00215500 [Aphelenchoides fujianensis]
MSSTVHSLFDPTVLVLRQPRFAARFDGAQTGDEWTSRAIGLEDDGPADALFFLRFRALRPAGGGTASRSTWSPSPPRRPPRCSAPAATCGSSGWTANGATFRVSRVLDDADALQRGGRPVRLFEGPLGDLRAASKLFVCVRLDGHVLRVFGGAAEGATLRWSLADFRRRHAAASSRDAWTSGALDGGFSLECRPQFTAYDDVEDECLELTLWSTASAAAAHVQTEVWLENEAGERTNVRAATCFDARLAAAGLTLYFEEPEFLPLVSVGEPLVVCVAVRRVQRLAAEAIGAQFDRRAARTFGDDRWADFEIRLPRERASFKASWSEGLGSLLGVPKFLCALQSALFRRHCARGGELPFGGLRAADVRELLRAVHSEDDVVRAIVAGRPVGELPELHERPLNARLAAAFDSADLSDLEVRAEGRSFKVAVFVLRVHSRRFDALLRPPAARVLTIDGHAAADVERLLRFLYGRPLGALDDPLALLRLAADYEVPELVYACTDRIVGQLTVESALDALRLAVASPALSDLQRRALRFAQRNAADVRRASNFAEFEADCPQLAAVIGASSFE